MLQKRLDGSVDFYRYWNDYKYGFCDLNGEFWLGLDKIHRLTSEGNNMLRIDMEDFEENTRYAQYNMFGMTGENDKYRMSYNSYSGNTVFIMILLYLIIIIWGRGVKYCKDTFAFFDSYVEKPARYLRSPKCNFGLGIQGDEGICRWIANSQPGEPIQF